MAETLDLAAHRLDAFVTGLATRRLLKFRAAERVAEPIPVTRQPTTRRLRLRRGRPAHRAHHPADPRPRARRCAGEQRRASSSPIAASRDNRRDPSQRPHRARRPIRRSTRSSCRRRGRARARELMDGLRDGQTQGAILGARLESGLRAAGQAAQPPINQMEAYILALRLLFPQVANKSGNDADSRIASPRATSSTASWCATGWPHTRISRTGAVVSAGERPRGANHPRGGEEARRRHGRPR